jgi:sec-independent protein translocase protein TatC
MSDEQEIAGAHQSLVDHLTELRIRLINSLYGILVCFGVCYYFSEQIFDVLRAPIKPYLPQGGLIYTGPMDKFMAHIKISFMAAIILSCPFWLYQAWLFVAPALYKKERKYAVGFIFSGTVLFICGILFTYFVVLPMAFKFLMTYGGPTDQPMISIEHYLSFVIQTALAFGAAFEMPLVISTLGMVGIISQRFLKEKRRYAVMGIAIVAAVITPPDLLSMCLMLVPMVALYEISVIVVGIFERRRSPDL